MTHTTPARLSAAAVIGAVALTACGGDGGDSADAADQGEEVQLRFSWWGSEHRTEATQEIIADFEEEHPHISIEPEFTDWQGYWDTLATQAAAGDAPDIMQMDEMYVREYADRGSLLELTDVDLSEFDDDIVESGQVEGAQYAITTGVNAFVMMANPDVFDEAGVELPDDTTWTWDDFSEITQEISENTEYVGVARSSEPQLMQNWLRQQGRQLVTEDGELGFEVDDAEDYLAFLKELLDEGSFPAAQQLVEDGGAGQDQSLTGTGQAGIGLYWTNQLPGLSASSGTDLTPLRFPSSTGAVEDNGIWFKSSMVMAAAATTDHQEEAQLFIDYFVNSEDAGRHNLVDRGLPSNESVREVVMDSIEGQDLASSEFIVEIEDEVGPAEPIPPAGFSALGEDIFRYQEEVFFGRMDPAEAAEAMVAEMEGSLE